MEGGELLGKEAISSREGEEFRDKSEQNMLHTYLN